MDRANPRQPWDVWVVLVVHAKNDFFIAHDFDSQSWEKKTAWTAWTAWTTPNKSMTYTLGSLDRRLDRMDRHLSL